MDEGSASRPGSTLPPGKTRYPLYRRLGGHQGRSELVRKISPPPGFDPRTVQPVSSRYTDYATRPTPSHILCINSSLVSLNTHVNLNRQVKPCHRLPTVRNWLTETQLILYRAYRVNALHVTSLNQLEHKYRPGSVIQDSDWASRRWDEKRVLRL